MFIMDYTQLKKIVELDSQTKESLDKILNSFSDVEGDSYAKLKENMQVEQKRLIEYLNNELELLKNETNTAEKYMKAIYSISAFRDKILEITDFFCIRAKEYAIKYAELIYASSSTYPYDFIDEDELDEELTDEDWIEFRKEMDDYNVDDENEDEDNFKYIICDCILHDYRNNLDLMLIKNMNDYYFMDVLNCSNELNSGKYDDLIHNEYRKNCEIFSKFSSMVSNTSDCIKDFESAFTTNLLLYKFDEAKENIEKLKNNKKSIFIYFN